MSLDLQQANKVTVFASIKPRKPVKDSMTISIGRSRMKRGHTVEMKGGNINALNINLASSVKQNPMKRQYQSAFQQSLAQTLQPGNKHILGNKRRSSNNPVVSNSALLRKRNTTTALIVGGSR